MSHPKDALDFAGKVALVTGGTRGVGRGIAERFLEAGADVVVCGRSEPDVAARRRAAGGRLRGRRRARARADRPRSSPRRSSACGRLDVLVNNAGGAPAVDAATASPRFHEKIIALNLIAPLHCAQRANAVMQAAARGRRDRQHHERLGLRPSPGTAAYGAAKAGLISLTQSLAVEWAPKVRVVAVAAGMVRTEQAHLHYGDEAGIAAVGATVPLGRMAEPARRRRRVPVPRLAARALRERRDPAAPRRRRAAGLPRGGEARRRVAPDWPPARGLDPVWQDPAMLPGLSTFVGREEESARLAELVGGHRLVSVVGPAGMGKTRLTRELLAAPPAGFAGGLRRCELAPLSARHDVDREVAGALGFASLEALVLGLGDARSLLLLDNCEHLIAAVVRLCERLLAEAPALHLLVTSRERLGIEGEEVLVLGPLASDAAARLFEDRARSAGAKLADAPPEVAARAELCRRLDGVPLAIELAAARARALSAAETLALLGRRFELLQRSGPLGLARHKSLRAAIDASYELLAPAEQAFFRALGVFAGPFTAPLAHAVAGADGSDLLHSVDALSRLVDRSLVGADPAGGVTRYWLLESLRDYAAERSRAAGEWAAQTDRFVNAMVGEAVRIVTAGSVRWSSELLASVLLHFEALVAALERTLESDGDATRAFRLLLPLWGATHQGRASEVAEIAERVLARWPQGEEKLRPEATAVAASALLAAGRIEDATLRARAVSSDPAATPLARVLALRTLGIVAHYGGDAAGARDCARRASELAGATGLPALERELRVFAASTAQGEDALAPALAELADVSALASAEGDPIGVVWAKVVATHLLVRAGRLVEARAELAIARQAQQGFEYPYGAKVTLRLAATLDALEHGWPDARASWLAAIEGCAASGDLAELALALRTAAALAARGGDAAASTALLDAVPPGVRPVILGAIFESKDEATLRARELATPQSGRTGAALRSVRELLARSGAAPSPPPREPARSGALVRRGELWTLRFAGKTAQLAHRKGLDDLAALLSRPEQDVHCLELIGGGDVGGDAGPALDARARGEYQARIRELQSESDEAREANDPGRAERAEAELDALVQQLSEAFGLGGRRRATGSAAERARSAVAWRIRSALKQVAAAHPELGRHLENAVRTGAWCSYRPEAPVAWEVEAAGPR